jgi:hypothetical protein
VICCVPKVVFNGSKVRRYVICSIIKEIQKFLNKNCKICLYNVPRNYKFVTFTLT